LEAALEHSSYATLDGASYSANNKMGRKWYATALKGLLAASLVSGEEAYTPKHEAGRCAIRGNCGKQSFFGSELPCPDNGLAKAPTKEVREQLIEICGAKWNTGPVCCEAEQVSFTSFAARL
jgi:Niemann-Pick C1 protein